MRNWFRALAILLLFILVVLWLAPRAFDEENIRDALVDQLSTAIGKPVKIERVTLRFLPTPSVRLQGIKATLGENPQERFQLGELSAEYSILKLMQGKLKINHLSLDNIHLSQMMLNNFKTMFAGSDQQNSATLLPVAIDSISVKNFHWQSAEQTYGPFQIMAQLDNSLVPTEIKATDATNSITLAITPGNNDWNFDLNSRKGRFPFKLPVKLDHFSIKGHYQVNHITFDDIQATGLKSTLQGTGTLDWSSGWQLDMTAATPSLELKPVLSALGDTTIPGKLAGSCAISMTSSSPSALLQQAKYSCKLDYLNQGTRTPMTFISSRKANRTSFVITTAALTLPVDPQLKVDNAAFKGTLQGTHLDITSAQIQAYDGEASINGRLDWSSGWRLDFASRSEGVQLERLMQAFDKHIISGTLTSQCDGSLQGTSFSSLLDNQDFDCQFIINHGLVYETDLEQAAQLIKTEDARPASEKQTPFDQLSGKVTTADEYYHFKELKIVSSALAASGNIEINPEQELNGKISVGLKKTGKVLSVPLVVAGTIQEPNFRPTKSSMTGAGAGTILLGPGLGTAIGAKLGEAVGNITGFFSKKTPTD